MNNPTNNILCYNIITKNKERNSIMCEMIKVESSNINSIGWEDNKLYVEYPVGTYVYEDVEREVYLGLLGARSRGRFMNEMVKGKYSYKKI